MNAKQFLSKNASTILTGIGAVGVVATAITAVKATPKAERLLQAAEQAKGEGLTKMEKVKVAGPAYIPAVMVGASTVACIFGANLLNKRTQASIASAYALLDNSYKEFKKKANELYGEEAVNVINTSIAEDHYEEQEIKADDDKNLYFDMVSLKYFRATSEDVTNAVMHINKKLVDTGYASLLDFYEYLDIDTGDEDYSALGWSSGYNFDAYWSSWVDFDFNKTVNEDGLECYIMTARTDPYIEYLNY